VAAAVRDRADRLRTGLSALPGVRVRDLGLQPCGLVSFTVDGVESAAVRDALHASSVYVTVSLAGSTLLDMTARDLPAVVRASPHYFVSLADIDAAVRAISIIA
jgi:cysteine desulfurase / selenocysteine lyase